jgi:hypothetical protein
MHTLSFCGYGRVSYSEKASSEASAFWALSTFIAVRLETTARQDASRRYCDKLIEIIGVTQERRDASVAEYVTIFVNAKSFLLPKRSGRA